MRVHNERKKNSCIHAWIEIKAHAYRINEKISGKMSKIVDIFFISNQNQKQALKINHNKTKK